MPMTRREIFEKVRTHLLAQGRKATVDRDDRDLCRYRTSEGLSCAALQPCRHRVEDSAIDLLRRMCEVRA